MSRKCVWPCYCEACVMERGADWAYRRLVNATMGGSYTVVRSIANEFKTEVVDMCYITALHDIDTHKGEPGSLAKLRLYKLVSRVCKDLLAERCAS